MACQFHSTLISPELESFPHIIHSQRENALSISPGKVDYAAVANNLNP